MPSYKPCIRKTGDQWVAIYWDGIQWITRPVATWRTAFFVVHAFARYSVVEN